MTVCYIIFIHLFWTSDACTTKKYPHTGIPHQVYLQTALIKYICTHTHQVVCCVYVRNYINQPWVQLTSASLSHLSAYTYQHQTLALLNTSHPTCIIDPVCVIYLPQTCYLDHLNLLYHPQHLTGTVSSCSVNLAYHLKI